MAISTVYSAKITALILIILCTETHIFASKDDVYTILANQAENKFQDISVIDYENVAGRYKRQSGNPGNDVTPSTKLEDMNLIHDDHSYYKSLMFKLTDVSEYWIELKDVAGHSTLSDSHRTAVTAKLPFPFPFYGHLIDNVTIATGGFLYMSPFLHQWLTATQYIAPLMANFDTKIGNSSEIMFSNVDQKFVVEWRDVHLKDQNGRSDEDTGSFRFQAILHQNGSIAFVYKQLPIPVTNISSKAHKVAVGIADAFYFDTVLDDGTKRRTIYEYHRVDLNRTYIEEGTIVLMNPQPTCNRYTDCESCVSANINFQCRWCGIIQRCSDSVDWHRQKWLNAGCVHLSVAGNETCSEMYNTTTTTNDVTNTTWWNQSNNQSSVISSSTMKTTSTLFPVPPIILPYPCNKVSGAGNCSSIPTAKPTQKEKQGKEKFDKKDSNSVDAQTGIIVVVVVIVVALFGAIGGWVYYAYTHPTSASGMWLMEHRPSQMKAKMSNMKFWNRNGTSGDKYAVESTA
ncbi:plexin domain-containing protein 2-like isoform X2 [Ruditapes philippinarum]|uniref:plexin domain-containing protein 2-like isoform X2 n=1 Tax=Ruditapes philippinarum TaxID=129788 RepID=UPI00295BD747|nr:plexin domain-containing protein 2-like isoform X2 [Ruditapes philippinarum]